MNYDKLTPMMKQYLSVKDKYPDTILFYRLGDFYEMFFDDAIEASRVLEIALTGRNAGLDEKVPMCGVPYHSSQAYLKKLIDKGYKVAICEQLEDASQSNKIVKRDVVKIISPGTNLDLQQKDYNFIMYIDNTSNSYYYLAFCDVSTGKLKAQRIVKDKYLLYNEILQYQIKEIVIDSDFKTDIFDELIKKYKFLISFVDLNQQSNSFFLNSINQEYKHAFSKLFAYIEAMQMDDITYYMEVEYSNDNFLKIDFNSKYSLELTSTIKNNDKYGTLFWYLDKTKTAMGSRLLKEFIEKPVTDLETLIDRHDFIDALIDEFIISETTIKQLRDVYDIARLAAKIGQKTITQKELIWLKQSIESSWQIINELKNSNKKILSDFVLSIDSLSDIKERIENVINVDLDNDNQKIINDGYNDILDNYRLTLSNSTKWLIDFELQQKELTGIKNLKVKYNKVFGYYIEVSNANKNLIKDEFNYIRKQTLTNAERYINTELKQQETLILTAQDNVSKLEQEIFEHFKIELVKETSRVQMLAQKMAYLDVMLSFYQISNNFGFSRPVFNNENKVEVIDSFHPIIKAIDKDRDFINNDFYMIDDVNVVLITGPNMGGKSTYMRQLSLIVIMAQIGCYVPAKKANLMLFDSLFTRIGASDDLVQGQSTFMVEMNEAANAILNLTNNSLILFDEIGRGTATYDGMAIAWAMIEYLAKQTKAKILFSTHYHELINLEKDNKNIINYHASVIESEKEITFTYKIKKGSIDKSYGIHVAKLAHLPDAIIDRSYSLLKSFEDKNDVKINNVEYIEIENNENNEIINELNEINIDEISPLEALNILNNLKKQVK